MLNKNFTKAQCEVVYATMGEVYGVTVRGHGEGRDGHLAARAGKRHLMAATLWEKRET